MGLKGLIIEIRSIITYIGCVPNFMKNLTLRASGILIGREIGVPRIGHQFTLRFA